MCLRALALGNNTTNESKQRTNVVNFNFKFYYSDKRATLFKCYQSQIQVPRQNKSLSIPVNVKL